MSFTTLNLTGERVLVKGTDTQGTEGSVVLDATEWNQVKRQQAHASAHEDFDATVEEFFAPLLAAAEKFEDSKAQPELDPIAYVVVHEGTPAVQGQDEVRLRLSGDSIVLRLLESGDTDRLVWVHEQLEVLETLPGTQPAQVVSSGPEPHEG